MKKLFIGLTAIICTLIMGLTLAACSSEVKGNTYVFSDFTVTYSSDYDGDERERLSEEEIADIKEEMKGTTITFNADGSAKAIQGEDESIVYYKQVGNKVYVGWRTQEDMEAATDEDLKEAEEEGEYYEVSGNKLIQSSTYKGATYTYTYVKK